MDAAQSIYVRPDKFSVLIISIRVGFNGAGSREPGLHASHQQRRRGLSRVYTLLASHQTLHILFLANDRCLRKRE